MFFVNAMLVAFIDNTLAMRGTQSNMWALAHHNETMLGNQSVVVVRNSSSHRDADTTDESVGFFTRRFETYFIPDPDALDRFLKVRGVNVAYVVLAGTEQEDAVTPKSVPTIVHCVFLNQGKKGTVRTAISPTITPAANQVLPYIVYVDREERGDLREELGISQDAIVIGRHGGMTTFDVPFVVNHIVECARARPHVVFLFMNTARFTIEHLPNIMFIQGSRDLAYKTRFIRTCDAMIHARCDGETFGTAVGEFSVLGRPVITTRCSYNEAALAHLDVFLRDTNRASIIHDTTSMDEAVDAVTRFDETRPLQPTGYDACTPENVMPLFASLLHRAHKPIHIAHLVLHTESNAHEQAMMQLQRIWYDEASNSTFNYTVNTVYYMFSYDVTEPTYDATERVLRIPGHESYIPGILNKTWVALQWAQHVMPPFDYIVRSNSSTLINFGNLVQQLRKTPVEYGGLHSMTLSWLDKQGGVYDRQLYGTCFASGTGIIWNRASFELLLNEGGAHLNRSIVDDVALGVVMNRLGKIPRNFTTFMYVYDSNSHFYDTWPPGIVHSVFKSPADIENELNTYGRECVAFRHNVHKKERTLDVKLMGLTLRYLLKWRQEDNILYSAHSAVRSA